jgi:hypothetical protein
VKMNESVHGLPSILAAGAARAGERRAPGEHTIPTVVRRSNPVPADGDGASRKRRTRDLTHQSDDSAGRPPPA